MTLQTKLYNASKNCSQCARLKKFRNSLEITHPDWYNKPVNSFGSINSELLILGLAPGKKGANRTGRPFTGDGAGKILFNELLKNNYATGNYDENANDNLKLINCRISNSVKCVPPNNKPIASEFNNCRIYLMNEINEMKDLKLILALGNDAFKAITKIYNKSYKELKFFHNKSYILEENLSLLTSYHCSRYNINTKRLTKSSFNEVFKNINKILRN